MEKYIILLEYYKKQLVIIKKLYDELIQINLSVYEARYVFALKAQQLYTAVEDLLKHVAKDFENHIEDLASSHKELLLRLHMGFPKIRPAVLSEESYLLLDKMRSFRHFIRHAYDCELMESELKILKDRLKDHYKQLDHDLLLFKDYVESLC